MAQRFAVAGLTLAGVMTAPLWADGARVSYSTYGTPGLVEMPTAQSLPDAELGTTVTYFENNTRSTIAFQLTPRLTASFRYSALEGLGGMRSTLFDRSFDLHYRIVDEGAVRPAVAVGLRDFIGTGVYSSEYVVATKTVAPNLTLTGGIGWGRLSDSNEVLNRQAAANALGGQVEAGNWFRGPAAPFAGVAWQATDKLQVKFEYSSDRYAQEVAGGTFTRKDPYNFGLDYRWTDNISLQAFYLNGSTLGASVNVMTNPRLSNAPSGTHAAPFPVRVRAPGEARDLGWTTNPNSVPETRARLKSLMSNEGLVVETMDLTNNRVDVRVRNTRYGYNAEAIGRTARVLTQTMPASVETFVIIPVVNGIPASAVTLRRSDVERYEHAPDGAEQMLAAAQITDGPQVRPAEFDPMLYPRFTWGLGPYARASYFDPDRPVRVGFGLQLNAEYNIAPGLFIGGTFRQRLGGNIDDSTRASNSVIQRVRSESNIYDREGESALRTLTLDYYFKPGKNVYGRVSAGYLEPQFGGVSAELLWKPVQSRFALGAEVNYVKQRDFDQGFGFRDYEVATGHISGYWEFTEGFHAQVDAGRYLAGDWGATFALDREFANGWSVGAYATITDVSAADFGEGSFDKGLRFTIPLEPLLGQASRRKFTTSIQPLTRDGGARLDVDGRLYETVREFHASGLESGWGRFWR